MRILTSLKYYLTALSQYRLLITQFIQFGLIGSTGLCLDIGSVYFLRPFIGLFPATLLAYFIAATSNWLLNRLWTFRTINHSSSLISQWIRYILTNILGFLCNRGTVFILFLLSDTCKNTPYIALIIGAVTGMSANFHLARKLVYTNNVNTLE